MFVILRKTYLDILLLTIIVKNRLLFLLLKTLPNLSGGNQKYKINKRSTYPKANNGKSNGNKNKMLT